MPSASEGPVQGLEVEDLSVCSEDGDYSCDDIEDSLDLKDWWEEGERGERPYNTDVSPDVSLVSEVLRESSQPSDGHHHSTSHYPQAR